MIDKGTKERAGRATTRMPSRATDGRRRSSLFRSRSVPEAGKLARAKRWQWHGGSVAAPSAVAGRIYGIEAGSSRCEGRGALHVRVARARAYALRILRVRLRVLVQAACVYSCRAYIYIYIFTLLQVGGDFELEQSAAECWSAQAIELPLLLVRCCGSSRRNSRRGGRRNSCRGGRAEGTAALELGG